MNQKLKNNLLILAFIVGLFTNNPAMASYQKNNLVGLNLIDGAGNIIDGKMMKEVGVHETFHGNGANEAYAEAMGDYAAERNGLFTIFDAGYGSSGTSGDEWLNQGTVNYNGSKLDLNSQPTFQSNAEYLAGNNAYFTLHGPDTTDNKPFIGSRDLKDPIPIGTHDFIKISNENPLYI